MRLESRTIIVLLLSVFLFIQLYEKVATETETAESSKRTYVLTANQNVFRQLFVGPNAEILSTIPLCYTEDVNDTDDGSTKLSNMTGHDYSKMMADNNQSALSVYMTLQFIQLINLDEKCQTVSMVMATGKFWNDCRLNWHTGNLSIYELEIAASMFRKLNVYTPNVRLLEALNPKESAQSETQIIIYSSGDVWLVEEYLSVFSCQIDVSMYPFDIQVCTLTFESVLTENWVDLMYYYSSSAASTSKDLVGRYTPSEQWALSVLPPVLSRRNTCLGKSTKDECWSDGLKYTVILRRNPNYQLTSLLFPAFLIVIISSCVFIVPPEGGDKMGLSVSILMALYMFSQLMYDKMPETGAIPLLSQYFMVCIGLITASCLYASISAVFASASPGIPQVLQKFLLTLGPYFIFDLLESKNFRKSGSSVTCGRCLSRQLKTPEISGLQVESSRLPPEHDSVECCSSKQASRGFCLHEPESLTWAAFGALLDRLFFVLHLVASVLVLVAYIVRGYIPWSGYAKLSLNKEQLAYMCAEAAMQNVSTYDLPCTANWTSMFEEEDFTDDYD